MKKVLLIAVLLCLISGCSALNRPSMALQWDRLPDLPDANGVAGPFAGIHNDMLIVAGGANFPEKKPWDGGKKVWHDRIYVLKKTAVGYKWLATVSHLPRPLAYGVSVNTDKGILCAGGCDSEKSYKDVFLLSWNALKQKVEVEIMPSLPLSLSKMSGARIGNKVYIFGGETEGKATKTFVSLDLSRKGAVWQQEAEFPGSARVMPVVAAQDNGSEECIFVISGKTPGPLHEIKFFTDTWMYSPARKEWTRKSNIINDMPAVAAPSAPVDRNKILVFGGGGSKRCSVGKRITNGIKIHELSLQTDEESRKKASKLAELNRELMIKDKGHREEVLSYDTIEDIWSIEDKMPEGRSVVTVQAFFWGNKIVIPSGETRPGVRTSVISFIDCSTDILKESR